MQNPVKTRLRQGKSSIGTWNMIGHPIVAEILARAGYDWVAVDTEHGVADFAQAVTQMQIIQGWGSIPLVRLPINEPVYFKWALDGGAYGVIVPMVNSAEDAHNAVAYARYPPAGIRGMAITRQHEFGSDFHGYTSRANDETLVALMIEHIEAVNHIEQILDEPGIDAIFIGPYDLSGSMNLMGQTHHPDVEKACQHALEVARAKGVAPGLHIVEPRPGELRQRIAEGYRFIALGMDLTMLNTSARDLLVQPVGVASS
jgi:2-dehydro-3-deoxyglucarate aldolase